MCALLVGAVGAFVLDMQSINILLTPQRNVRNVSLSTSATARLAHTSLSPRPHQWYQNDHITLVI